MVLEKLEETKFFQKVKELHKRYGIDKIELSKIMIIASTTLLVVSVHGALNFKSAYDQVEDANNELGTSNVILDLQETEQVLSNFEGGGLGVDPVLDSLRQMENSLKKTKQAEKRLETSYQNYQWMALIGILGIVAGVSIFYV